MKKKIFVFLAILILIMTFSVTNVFSYSYLADKAEIPVTLTSTGARSICQTDDGYVWIGQFAGLNRYDSKELVSYNSFTDDDGNTQTIENVKCLANYHNSLYMASSTGLIKYDNHKFSKIDLPEKNLIINDLLMESDGILYISTSNGLYSYNTNSDKLNEYSNVKGRIDSAVKYNSSIYLLKNETVVDLNDEIVFDSTVAGETATVNSIYSFENIMVIASKGGKIYFYDLDHRVLTSNVVTLSEKKDMAHDFIYSKMDKVLFAACEKGLYSINIDTYQANYAKKLEKSSKLVDLMIDYENNLWVASYIDGVSIITQSNLLDILFDVSKDDMPEGRLVYAIQKYGNDLFLATGNGIFVYDLNEEKIDNDYPLITKINQIMSYDEEKKKEDNTYQLRIPYYDVRDIEIFKGKLYFATYGSGLIEYNPDTEELNLYDGNRIIYNGGYRPFDPENPDEEYDTNVNNQYYAAAHRCLYATDDYLFIGTATNSMIRFDGIDFIYNKSIPNTGQILYIASSAFGNITYVGSGSGIHTINENLESGSVTSVPGIDETTSGVLKFYQDGDNFFYNIYGRFFVIDTKDGNYSASKEIKIPYINGSVTEINKVNTLNENGEGITKYVLASEKQIYIIDDLLADNLVYDFYDSSNGLKSPIKGNSSGYYDDLRHIYYFQSQDGVFAYDFNIKEEKRIPLKISVNSVKVDDSLYYGDSIEIDKNSDRITFNLSIFSFKPTKGYKIYYKLDGVDKDYVLASDSIQSVSYTNLSGGEYKFHIYVVDEVNQMSNQIDIDLVKPKHLYEYEFFWIIIGILGLTAFGLLNFFIIHRKAKQSRKRELELKEITIESIEAIARTIDAKDTYTNGHSIRVGHFSRIIAKELGMEGDELENLYYIALLHDIGKIGIPDAILNKPGRLTDEEFEIMKSHTTKGAKILKDISTIPNIVEGAKYHHEKYGGGGYPEGLKGEEIPYIARIICCADCFDAMATRRVYKDPYPKEKIISEFERCKEIQFDPKIADVVIKLIEEGKLKADYKEEDTKISNEEKSN